MPKEKVTCRTPNPGKKATNIDRWKFDAVHSAILQAVPSEEPGLYFRDLPKEVAKRLTPHEKKRLGSISWFTTTVKLEMEVRGELRRLSKSPQRLLRSA
ncbi:MAG TPA: hypothetical protein VLV83_17820 [Acidobacteriota bacterium]|nr:hypothetical protein [Acidobacteriota bacterium]